MVAADVCAEECPFTGAPQIRQKRLFSGIADEHPAH